ncbi:hypothetical protein BVX98_07445 [bacterium F11]|nr:hypothetical protein BVX98_07445 [bacterium F11]
MTNIHDWIKDVGFLGFLDIFFIAILIYAILIWFKRTRAAFVLTGIVIISAIYLLARQLNLSLTAGALEKFFAIILIALVVIFQEELRHFFERVAVWSLDRRFMQKKGILATREEVDTLVRTVYDLARVKVGALIVIRGKDMIARHLTGGADLDGIISEPILKSIFDPGSLGHDGALIIEGNRITKFACHLPLSKNLKAVGNKGTRHTASLGLSELSDALCLVVSEERGIVSIAREGKIKEVSDPEQLSILLEDFLQNIHPRQKTRFWDDVIKRNGIEKLLALCLALSIWFVFDHGAKIIYKTYTIPIQINDLPKPWIIQDIDPNQIKLTFEGPRKSFYFLKKENLIPMLKLKMEPGVQVMKLSPEEFRIPTNITLSFIKPQSIKIRIDNLEELEKENQKK